MSTTETIQETTVGDLGGVSVGVANLWERDYVDAAGAPRHGMTARVAWTDASSDHWEVVGAGSALRLGAHRWTVVRVDKSEGSLGSVTWTRDDGA